MSSNAAKDADTQMTDMQADSVAFSKDCKDSAKANVSDITFTEADISCVSVLSYPLVDITVNADSAAPDTVVLDHQDVNSVVDVCSTGVKYDTVASDSSVRVGKTENSSESIEEFLSQHQDLVEFEEALLKEMDDCIENIRQAFPTNNDNELDIDVDDEYLIPDTNQGQYQELLSLVKLQLADDFEQYEPYQMEKTSMDSVKDLCDMIVWKQQGNQADESKRSDESMFTLDYHRAANLCPEIDQLVLYGHDHRGDCVGEPPTVDSDTTSFATAKWNVRVDMFGGEDITHHPESLCQEHLCHQHIDEATDGTSELVDKATDCASELVDERRFVLLS